MPRLRRQKGGAKYPTFNVNNPQRDKLTPELVRQIRVLSQSYKLTQVKIVEWLEKVHGIKVNRSVISLILTGRIWSHVV